MKRTLCIVLTLLLALSLFAACSKSGSSTGGSGANLEPTLKNVSGSYNLKSLNGKDVKSALREAYGEEDYKDFLEYFHLDENNLNDFLKMTLKEDGSCTIEEAGMTGSGTWKLEGDKVTITIDGETEVGTWSNGILTINAPNDNKSDIQSMEFQKVS